MDELSILIKDAFNIISLILVFIFVLFGIRYPQVLKELEKDIPDRSLKLARQQHRKKLWECLINKTMLLVIVNGMLFYLFLPLLVKVITSSEFRIWNFDFLRTAFVFVVMLIGLFLGWSVYLVILLSKRISECR